MLPTTYRGDATIDGEQLSAELRLDDRTVRLITGRHAELLSWPLSTVAVEAKGNGVYSLRAGESSFEFNPVVDDGLGEEIALRTRFAPVTGMPAAPRPAPDRSRAPTPTKKANPGRRANVLSGGDLAVRTALIVLALLALAVVSAAFLSGSFETRPASVVVTAPVGTAAPEATLPFTEEPGGPEAQNPSPAPTAPAAPVTTQPAAPAETVPPATTLPAEPSATTPPETVAPAVAGVPALDLTPDELRQRWDQIAAGLDHELVVDQLAADGTGFTLDVNHFVDVEGTVAADGTIAALRFTGDPSGTVADDRRVITALGVTVAVVAPDLDPSGRRGLLEALGFDVHSPSLAGLDGELSYRGYHYHLRWDEGLGLIVFEVTE